MGCALEAPLKIFAQPIVDAPTKRAADAVKDAVPSKWNLNWSLGSYDAQSAVQEKVVAAYRTFEQSLGSSDSLESLKLVSQLGKWMKDKNPDLAELVVPDWVSKRTPEQQAHRLSSESQQRREDARDRIRDKDYSVDAAAKRT